MKSLVGYHSKNKQIAVNDLGETVEFTPSTLIVETESDEVLSQATQWAKDNGYTDLTVSTLTDTDLVQDWQNVVTQ